MRCAPQVGVSIPSPAPTWNSQRTIQRITLRNALASQQRVLRLLYPPGNDTVLDITTSAAAGSNTSLLGHPLLGLNITVNGAQLPELVQLAGGQAAADRLDSLLQQALGLSDLDVGVELLAADSRLVTLRVAVPRAKVGIILSAMHTLSSLLGFVVAEGHPRLYDLQLRWHGRMPVRNCGVVTLTPANTVRAQCCVSSLAEPKSLILGCMYVHVYVYCAGTQPVSHRQPGHHQHDTISITGGVLKCHLQLCSTGVGACQQQQQQHLWHNVRAQLPASRY